MKFLQSYLNYINPKVFSKYVDITELEINKVVLRLYQLSLISTFIYINMIYKYRFLIQLYQNILKIHLG